MKSLVRMTFGLLLLALAVSLSKYQVTNESKNSSSITLELRYTGSDEYYGNPKSPIIKELRFVFTTHTYQDFHFKIYDPNNPRFQIPQTGVFPADPVSNFSFPISASAVSIEYNTSPFDFKIIRRETSAVLYSTYEQRLIFSDKYIEIGTQIDSGYFYGLGERFLSSFRYKDGKWTMFNRGRGKAIDTGKGEQSYGYYPIYLLRQSSGMYHLNYIRSSNALDVIKSTLNSKNYLTFKIIGGVLDYRYFIGREQPQAVVKRFHEYQGASAISPFWGLGYHQSRWGYHSVEDLEKVINQFQSNDIPLDVIWNDIDYMVEYEDFTIDESRFPLDRMEQIIKTRGYHYIPIIDAGIKASGQAYEEGLKQDLYVKDGSGKQPFIGRMWPGLCTYPDFFHPNGSAFWIKQFQRLYAKIQFSGVWLDENEPSNRCNGPCSTPEDDSTFDFPKDLPYQPGADNIEMGTISLNSTHYGGLIHADVHVFAGFLETVSTYQFLKQKSDLPFIITRSGTVGSSKYGFHWTGDNLATWDFLRCSIPDMFNGQLVGYQVVGPDICGFGGNTTEQLCARWYQLGSMYTFARNHNERNAIDQQPYNLGPNVLLSARNNLKLRYSLLNYIYFWIISQKGLGTIWRPLFFQFTGDEECLKDEVSDTQFLIGDSLMGVPILEQGQTSRRVYFPSVSWFDLQHSKRYSPGWSTITDVSITDQLPLFSKVGSIVFTQDTTSVTKTSHLDNHFILHSGLDFDEKASNSTHKLFFSQGSMLSLSELNNQSKVKECLKGTCRYFITIKAVTSSTTGSLTIKAKPEANNNLSQAVFIDRVQVNIEGQVFSVALDPSFKVDSESSVTIQLYNRTKVWTSEQ